MAQIDGEYGKVTKSKATAMTIMMTTLSFHFRWSIVLFSLLIGIHSSGQLLDKLKDRQPGLMQLLVWLTPHTHLIRATCLGRLNAHLCQRHKNVQACFVSILCACYCSSLNFSSNDNVACLSCYQKCVVWCDAVRCEVAVLLLLPCSLW